MNFFTKNISLLFLAMLITNVLFAQFYIEDFGNEAAAEANWTNGGTNGGTEIWRWSDDPSAVFQTQPTFGAPTASNGFFTFNSDENGPNAHNVTLTGPAINCSAQSSVIVSFASQYSFYSLNGGSMPFFGVSTDGTNFTYFEILSDVEQNVLTESLQNTVINITDIAAGEPTVYLQFRWDGFFEYDWKIDDVALSNDDPTPANDLRITTNHFAPNFFQPNSQLDTVRFAVTISNMGTEVQTNVTTTAIVLRDGENVFSTSTSLNTIPIGTIDTLIEMQEVYTMEGEGQYTITYEVTQDGGDANIIDNVSSRTFNVLPGLFAKDDGDTQNNASQPNDIIDNWEIGNVYYIKNGGYRAEEIFFSVFSENDTHKGQSVPILIYKIVEDNNPLSFTDDDVELVGFVEYEFAEDDESYELLSAVPQDVLTGEDFVVLEEDTDYIAMINYKEDMFAPFSPIPYFFQVTTIVNNNGDWFLGGFGPRNTALVRMRIGPTEPINTEDIQLDDANKVEVFPNPATEILTLDVDLSSVALQANVKIMDATGKVVYNSNYDNVQKEKMEFNVSQFPAGAYNLYFGTENGVRNVRFVVVR